MTATLAKWTAVWLTAVTAALTAPRGHAGLGDLDVRFGSNGRLEIAGSADAQVLVHPDGSLHVIRGACSATGVDDLILTRWLADGRPDLSYGLGGRIVVPMTVWKACFLKAAALQPDGKILLAGAGGVDLRPDGSDPWIRWVARIDSRGNLDPGFGTGGVANGGDAGPQSPMFGPGYSALRVLPNGEILALINDGGVGIIDRFGADGRSIASSRSDAVIDFAADPDGAAIVLSRRGQSGVLWRLLRNGEIDQRFGQKGFAEFEGGWDGTIAVDPTGPILVCDSAGIRAFDAVGRVDTSFGRGRTGFVSFAEVLGSGGSRTCEVIAPSSSAAGTPLLVVARGANGYLGSPTVLFIGLDRQELPDPNFDDGQGWVATRVGPAFSAGQWRLRSLDFPSPGNAILSWAVTIADEARTVVESVEFGAEAGRGAVGIPTFDPRLPENHGESAVPVVRSGSAAGEASVRYELIPVTSSLDDATVVTGELNWKPGDRSSREISILLVDDALLEGEETFRLRLFAASGVDVPQEFTTVTIVDDDVLRSLRFDRSRITWTQGPDIPDSSRPRLSLWLDAPVPGPVTAYHYQAEAVSSCCLGRVQWAAGDAGARDIPLSPFVSPGNSFYVGVTDDFGWVEGPSASVEVVALAPPSSTPPQTGTSPFNPTPKPTTDGGGGGALDLAAAAALLGLLLRGRLRIRRRLR